MPLKDLLFALVVVSIWGFNFVIIKWGLQGLTPLALAAYRFVVVLFPAIFFIKPPKVRWDKIVLFGLTQSFGQFAFLFSAISVGMPAGLASVVLVMLLGQPRIFYSMARDGLLPSAFGKVHPKFQTPYISTLITGTVAAVVGGLFPIGLLGELVSIGTLLAFVIVSAGVLVLRYRSPDLVRPFKTPFVPAVPILAIVFCGYLMYGLPTDTWLRLMIWMALGLVIYFGFGKRNSKLGKAGP